MPMVLTIASASCAVRFARSPRWVSCPKPDEQLADRLRSTPWSGSNTTTGGPTAHNPRVRSMRSSSGATPLTRHQGAEAAPRPCARCSCQQLLLRRRGLRPAAPASLRRRDRGPPAPQVGGLSTRAPRASKFSVRRQTARAHSRWPGCPHSLIALLVGSHWTRARTASSAVTPSRRASSAATAASSQLLPSGRARASSAPRLRSRLTAANARMRLCR